MKREVFRKRINKAERFLFKKISYTVLKRSKNGEVKYKKVERIEYNGVCITLDLVFKYGKAGWVEDVFGNLFKPTRRAEKGYTYDAYWLGVLNKRNHSKRITALRLFERVCLEDKLYLEFK